MASLKTHYRKRIAFCRDKANLKELVCLLLFGKEKAWPWGEGFPLGTLDLHFFF